MKPWLVALLALLAYLFVSNNKKNELCRKIVTKVTEMFDFPIPKVATDWLYGRLQTLSMDQLKAIYNEGLPFEWETILLNFPVLQ